MRKYVWIQITGGNDMKFLLEKGETGYGRFNCSFIVDELDNDIDVSTPKKQMIEKCSKGYKALVEIIECLCDVQDETL